MLLVHPHPWYPPTPPTTITPILVISPTVPSSLPNSTQWPLCTAWQVSPGLLGKHFEDLPSFCPLPTLHPRTGRTLLPLVALWVRSPYSTPCPPPLPGMLAYVGFLPGTDFSRKFAYFFRPGQVFSWAPSALLMLFGYKLVMRSLRVEATSASLPL